MDYSDSPPSSLPLLFSNSVWERTCPRNSVASETRPHTPAVPPPKQSFAHKRVPKRSLGTRTIGDPAHYFIPTHVHH